MADTEPSLWVSHSIMRDDAGVKIAASQSVANQFFLLEKGIQVVPTCSGAVQLTLKAAHLNNWLHGLTFSADQLLASPISC